MYDSNLVDQKSSIWHTLSRPTIYVDAVAAYDRPAGVVWSESNIYEEHRTKVGKRISKYLPNLLEYLKIIWSISIQYIRSAMNINARAFDMSEVELRMRMYLHVYIMAYFHVFCKSEKIYTELYVKHHFYVRN